MRSEDLYLLDIIVSAEAAAEFIRDVSWERFAAERLIRSAVIHELQTIGEAVSRLSAGLKLRHPGIPWAEIVGFRNVVVHEYFGVNMKLVWNTALNDAPLIQGLIAEVLKDEYPQAYAQHFEEK